MQLICLFKSFNSQFVSILVFMEGECNVHDVNMNGTTKEFQSLFLWRENATENHIKTATKASSFNPCFYGGRMQHKYHLRGDTDAKERVSILVFMEGECN